MHSSIQRLASFATPSRAGGAGGVQTEGGSAFIAGVTAEVEPAVNDLWSVPGEEALLARWQQEDRALTQLLDPMTHYHKLQIQDFLDAILQDREPLVTGEQGRKAVELFEAIYRSQRGHAVVSFPLGSYTLGH
jgi:UDP-N-acetyl-2-amino-2-deoxyglucuronate dehydrogenase